MRIYLAILFMLGTSPFAVAAKDELHFFHALQPHLKYPEDPTANSTAQLVDSVIAIAEAFPVVRERGTGFVAKEAGRTRLDPSLPHSWLSPRGREIPLGPLFALHAAVEAAFVNHGGMALADARVLGFTAQRAVIEDLNESWPAYAEFLAKALKGFGVDPQPTSPALQRATSAAAKLTTVDWSNFDVPYLGGYSVSSARKIYFDRDLPKGFRARSGRVVKIGPYLNLHEIAEKALLLELKLTKWDYRRCHQIAQRLEKAAVLADEISWSEYQDDFFGSQDAVADKAPRAVPADFDFTPYRDMEDWELIKQMKAVLR